MKPQLILHIGPHKTGSTSLQVTLSHLEGALLSRGVKYPRTWRDDHGHHRLVDILRAGAEVDTLRGELEAASAEVGTVLLSSENLALLSVDELRPLSEAVEGWDVRVIYYLRSWADVMFSAWQEGVKHGRMLSFGVFCYEEMAAPFSSVVINPGQALEPYAELFGVEALSVVSYDGLRRDEVDLVHHFLELVLGRDHDVSVPKKGRRLNTSIGAADAELLRVLNVVAQSTDKALWGLDLHTAYLRARQKEPELFAEVDPLLRPSTRELVFNEHSFPSQHVRRRFDALYRDCCVNPSDAGSSFADPVVRRVPHVSDHYLVANPPVVGMLHQLYAALCAREPRG